MKINMENQNTLKVEFKNKANNKIVIYLTQSGDDYVAIDAHVAGKHIVSTDVEFPAIELEMHV